MDIEKTLLEKDKLKLETEKLKREIELDIEFKKLEFEQNRNEADKSRQKRDHVKALVGLAVTVISILISAFIAFISIRTTENISKETLKINEETLRQSKLERFDSLKSEFDHPNTSEERKSNIANGFVQVRDTTFLSDNEREQYVAYYSTYSLLVEDKEKIAANSNKLIDDQEKNINSSDREKLIVDEAMQVTLENKLNNTTDTTERREIENQINDISKNNTIASEIVKQLDTLSTAQLQLTQFEKGSSGTQPKVTWFKENYFRQFGDIILTLSQLNSNEKSGIVKVSEKIGDSYTELYKIPFIVPQKKSFVYNNNTYVIDFVKIDRAGKNPFTKAVYFSYSKLKQAPQTNY